MKNIKKLTKGIPIIAVALLVLITFGCEEEEKKLPKV